MDTPVPPNRHQKDSRNVRPVGVVEGGQPALLAENEEARLAALDRYAILDTLEEQEYDDLARVAAEITGRPIGLVSLVDRHRQWFKAHHGLAARETPRDVAFCAHAILEPEQAFVVPDAEKDPRFADNPLVVGDPHVRSYVGIPLRDPRGGLPLGTLCVIDQQANAVSERQLRSLWGLARQVERLLELRASIQRLRDQSEILEEKAAVAEAANAALLERNRAMRLVLDNVDQGVLTLDRTGRVPSERSRILDTWFGAPGPGATLWDLLSPDSAALRAYFQLCWAEVVDENLPLELALDQMPARVSCSGRTYGLQYSPIEPWEECQRVLVIVTDTTEQLKHQRLHNEDRALFQLFARWLRDRGGVADFVASTRQQLSKMAALPPSSGSEAKLLLHTLKGNCSVLGLDSVAEACHEIESDALLRSGEILADEIQRLSEQWGRVEERLHELCGDIRDTRLFVGEAECRDLLQALEEGQSHAGLIQLVASWRREPVQGRLERAALQAQRLAERLHKAPLEVQVVSNGVRLGAERWAPLWQVLPHILRNAVDHGIETPKQRHQAGKLGPASIVLETRCGGDEFVFEVRDSGRGLDWAALAQCAVERGLPASNPAQLQEALFAEGLSTRNEATAISGRGLGMSAVKATVESLGGSISVQSAPGQGCRVRMVWPAALVSPEFGAPEPSGVRASVSPPEGTQRSA